MVNSVRSVYSQYIISITAAVEHFHLSGEAHYLLNKKKINGQTPVGNLKYF